MLTQQLSHSSLLSITLKTRERWSKPTKWILGPEMQTLCEPRELSGLSIAAVLLLLWDRVFYYGVFYCCQEWSWQGKGSYKMKLPILGRLPPPVKALRALCMRVHVHCKWLQGMDVHCGLVCLLSLCEMTCWVSKINKPSAISLVALIPPPTTEYTQ